MKRISLSLLFILLMLISTNVYAATGDIQVTCEPNVRILIDNNYKGITNESDGGLFIEGLSTGGHTLKAIKKGYDPFIRNISIIADKAIEIKISFGERKEQVKSLQPEEGQTLSQVGRMELRSVPLGAKVTIDGKSYQQRTDMEIENIPIGQHRITFERGNKRLTGLFYLNENQTLKLKAHFKENRIIDLVKIERAALEADERQRRAEAERADFIKKNKTASISIGQWIILRGATTIYEKWACQTRNVTNCKKVESDEGEWDISTVFGIKAICISGPCVNSDTLTFDYRDNTGIKKISFKCKTIVNQGEVMTRERHNYTATFKYCIDGQCVESQNIDEKVVIGNYQLSIERQKSMDLVDNMDLIINRTDL
jgi:hypothetical protein